MLREPNVTNVTQTSWLSRSWGTGGFIAPQLRAGLSRGRGIMASAILDGGRLLMATARMKMLGFFPTFVEMASFFMCGRTLWEVCDFHITLHLLIIAAEFILTNWAPPRRICLLSEEVSATACLRFWMARGCVGPLQPHRNLNAP